MHYNKNSWSLDVSKLPSERGDVTNLQEITQSIENILMTIPGERLHLPEFGSELQSYLFRGLTVSTAESLLSSIITSIQRWEKRVTINQNECRIRLYQEKHMLDLTIAYNVASIGPATFNRRIVY
jgi:phage baseplate assembly protein W